MNLENITKILDIPNAYELWSKVHLPPRAKLIRKLSGVKPGARVLELGCGPGTTRLYFKDCDFYGIDLSEAYVAYAAKRYGNAAQRGRQTQFLVGDVTNDAMHSELNGSFDLVLLNGCLHHLPPEVAEGSLRSMKRFVKAGGAAMIVDQVWPEETDPPSLSKFLRSKLIQMDRGKFTKREQEIVRLMQNYFGELKRDHVDVGIPGIPFWRYLGILGSRAN